MISRQVNLLKLLGKTSSILLLGARGLGKTKLSEQWISLQPASLIYNLLDPYEFKKLLSNPSQLLNEVETKLATLSKDIVLSVFIDEVQKIPDLLNVCHLLIEKHKNKVRFLLTGSSARKLKTQSANLLASRALSVRPLLLVHCIFCSSSMNFLRRKMRSTNLWVSFCCLTFCGVPVRVRVPNYYADHTHQKCYRRRPSSYL